jgi:hypothetical protein
MLQKGPKSGLPKWVSPLSRRAWKTSRAKGTKNGGFGAAAPGLQFGGLNGYARREGIRAESLALMGQHDSDDRLSVVVGAHDAPEGDA